MQVSISPCKFHFHFAEITIVTCIFHAHNRLTWVGAPVRPTAGLIVGRHNRTRASQKGAFASAPSASSARILPSFGSQQRWIGPRSHSASADDADCADGIFGACTHPDHYPHPAFTPERDLDAHRRRRPASARGLFVPGVPLENSSRAVSAHKRNRSDALPVHIVRRWLWGLLQ